MQPFTFLYLLLSTVIEAAPAESIFDFDQIVVVIEEKLITKSDVEKDVALNEYLPMQSAILQSIRDSRPLDSLVVLEIVLHMAGDTSLYKADPQKIEQRFQSFKQQWTDSDKYVEYLRSINTSEEQLRLIIEKHIVAEGYVYRNLGIKQTSLSPKDQQAFQQWIADNSTTLSIRYTD